MVRHGDARFDMMAMVTMLVLVLVATASHVSSLACPATVFVTHPFADPATSPTQCGHWVSVMSLDPNGTLALEHTISTDLCPERIVMSRDGLIAILITNDGSGGTEPVTQSVVVLERRPEPNGVCSFTFVEMARFDKEFNDRNPTDIVITPGAPDGADSYFAYVSDFDPYPGGAVHILKIKRDSSVVVYGGILNIPFASAMRLLTPPGSSPCQPSHLVVLGGDRPTDTVVIAIPQHIVVANYTLYNDEYLQAEAIGVSPSPSSILLVPNASPFSDNFLTSITISWKNLTVPFLSVATKATLEEGTSAVFSQDGKMALVTQFSHNAVSWFRVAPNGNFTLGGVVTGVPLADRVTAIRRDMSGTNTNTSGSAGVSGLILVTAVTDVHVLRFDASAGLQRVAKYSFPDAIESLCGDIAAQGADW